MLLELGFVRRVFRRGVCQADSTEEERASVVFQHLAGCVCLLPHVDVNRQVSMHRLAMGRTIASLSLCVTV